MRLPGFIPSIPTPEGSLLGKILPPNPAPPERPTIPPPTCGTLPPELPSLPDLLGTIKRPGR
jgi:hypothetical protein